MQKRTAKTLLSLVFIFTLIVTSAFAETDNTREDTHFQTYSVSMCTTDDDRLHVILSVSAVETSAIIGVTTFDVEQKVNGEWVTVARSVPGRQKLDAVTCTFSRNFTGVEIGARYRVYATMYCQKYDGTERYLYLTSSSYVLGD